MLHQPMQVGSQSGHRKWGPKPLTISQRPRRRWRENPLALSLVFIGVVCIGAIIGRLAAVKLSRKASSHGKEGLGSSALPESNKQASTSTSKSGETSSMTRIAAQVLQDSSTARTESLSKPSGDSRSSTQGFLHSWDDQALFRRVMDTVKAEGGPHTEGHPKKIALMFLTLGGIPLAAFWSRFLGGNEGKFSIYLHSTEDESKYANEHLPPVFHGRRVPGKSFGWGHMDVVEAERRLLANALLDPDNERFVLLTDSCVPLFNFSFTYSFLMNSPHSFVKGMHVGSTEVVGTGHWNADFLPLITLRQWVIGGTWFVLHRDLALAVVKDFSFFSVFSKACEFAKGCYPEEHYVQTMLHMLYSKKLLNRTLTWDDWSGGGITPSWFSETDVLPKNITQSLVLRLGVNSKSTCSWRDGTEHPCYLFARQFKPSTLDSLLILSPHMGFPVKGKG